MIEVRRGLGLSLETPALVFTGESVQREDLQSHVSARALLDYLVDAPPSRRVPKCVRFHFRGYRESVSQLGSGRHILWATCRSPHVVQSCEQFIKTLTIHQTVFDEEVCGDLLSREGLEPFEEILGLCRRERIMLKAETNQGKHLFLLAHTRPLHRISRCGPDTICSRSNLLYIGPLHVQLP